MLINDVSRTLPEQVGSYRVVPYSGRLREYEQRVQVNRSVSLGSEAKSKLLPSLEAAIQAVGLKDGMTISFHHCFREGDYTVGIVLEAIAKQKIKDLKFAPSAVSNVSNCDLTEYVRNGTITSVEASGIRGKLGNGLINGDITLKTPAILRPHGARPRAIESGELSIDVAFIAASAADIFGNCTGQIGAHPCGSLGYAFIDATHSAKTIVLTDTLVDYPCIPTSISQQYVDYVVQLPQIGDSEKIGAGAARLTKNPRDLMIAEKTADVICASSLFQTGFSFQTGVGAISIACTKYLAQRMKERGVTAGFALGGIPAAVIEMYDAGQIRAVACSQSFDAVAAGAIFGRAGVIEIDNSDYSNPYRKGNYLKHLNFGVLGALEVDVDFNVNILTGSSGQMMGGLGGGPDVAEEADISIVVLPIIRGRTPSVVKRVLTCCTPGKHIACVVTQAGIALNPRHRHFEMLQEDLKKAGIATVSITYLQELAYSITGEPKPISTTDEVAAVVEARDGSVLDVIRRLRREGDNND